MLFRSGLPIALRLCHRLTSRSSGPAPRDADPNDYPRRYLSLSRGGFAGSSFGDFAGSSLVVWLVQPPALGSQSDRWKAPATISAALPAVASGWARCPLAIAPTTRSASRDPEGGVEESRVSRPGDRRNSASSEQVALILTRRGSEGRAPTWPLVRRDPRWRVGLLASDRWSSGCAFVRRTPRGPRLRSWSAGSSVRPVSDRSRLRKKIFGKYFMSTFDKVFRLISAQNSVGKSTKSAIQCIL